MHNNKAHDPFWLRNSDFTAAVKDIRADIADSLRREQEKQEQVLAKCDSAEPCCDNCAAAALAEEKLSLKQKSTKPSYVTYATGSTGPR